MKKLIAIILFVPAIACGSPFVVSDPFPPDANPMPTHCGFFLDGGAKVEVPVTTDATGTYCKWDLTSSLATGSHTVTATSIYKDEVWATESDVSLPLVFVKPAKPGKPIIFVVK